MTLEYNGSSKLDQIKMITHFVFESLIQLCGVIITFWMLMRSSFKSEAYEVDTDYKAGTSGYLDQPHVFNFLPIPKENNNDDLDI